MDKKEVLTLIRRDHNLRVGVEFIEGKLAGIGYMIRNQRRGFIITEICEGYLYGAEFTPDEYDKFMNIVEELYPGLCEFNYQIKESE